MGDRNDRYGGLTAGEIRSLAVQIVDDIHGYTLEFSNQPNAHAEDYDRVERQLLEAHTADSGTGAAE